MTALNLPLYLPVESHVRELDGKILLAAAAAERKRRAVVGFQTDMRQAIARWEPGVYLAKSFTPPTTFFHANFLRMYRDLGHAVVAWDEEGLVHAGPAIYGKRRAGPETLAVLKSIFTWGPDNSALLRALPYYAGTPIHETGNPRIDLLDARVRGYFEDEVRALNSRYGRFILVNSNFGRVNPVIGKGFMAAAPGGKQAPAPKPITGQEAWSSMLDYRRAMFGEFQAMLAKLAAAFPERQIVLRPHPAERADTWVSAAQGLGNVHVINEGPVAPWILASEVLIHNGCTTAIEAVLLDRPVIAYRPITSEKNDWRLPNEVSHEALSFDALSAMIAAHLSGQGRLSVTPAQRARLVPHVATSDEDLAIDRILDVIDRHEVDWRPRLNGLVVNGARLHAALRSLEVRLTRALIPRHLHSRSVQDMHFPPLTATEVSARLARFRDATGRFAGVTVRALGPKLYEFRHG